MNAEEAERPEDVPDAADSLEDLEDEDLEDVAFFGEAPNFEALDDEGFENEIPVGTSAAVEAFDEAVEQLFARLRGNPVADRVFYTASELGNFSILWHALAWAGATSKRGRRRALRVSVALAVESALVNGPIKSAFNRSRPLAEHDHPHRLRQPLTSSFPSGHASAAVVAAALLSESRRRRWPFWAAASVVATSRVHVRIHHASDVVVGALVGAVIVRVFKKIWPLS
ncbi:MAG: phosphatase PAP2 family protein [Acidimicrobiia bacterium]|nr:phosphatase PAP2 family protein [Acidimicrobiia bacterium]MYG58128.1 phosphatase PAP2 family protein [Acidimicrobiia bacterium]MYJ32967.1 phosphatase PAP2 family protein [Acidimicrobiia bacterium]